MRSRFEAEESSKFGCEAESRFNLKRSSAFEARPGKSSVFESEK